jgi:hypothetical protein
LSASLISCCIYAASSTDSTITYDHLAPFDVLLPQNVFPGGSLSEAIGWGWGGTVVMFIARYLGKVQKRKKIVRSEGKEGESADVAEGDDDLDGDDDDDVFVDCGWGRARERKGKEREEKRREEKRREEKRREEKRREEKRRGETPANAPPELITLHTHRSLAYYSTHTPTTVRST